jgi:hypothetical protein
MLAGIAWGVSCVRRRNDTRPLNDYGDEVMKVFEV